MRSPVPDAAGREAWVVIPAKDEVLRAGMAIDALDAASAEAGGTVHLVFVDDGSTDGTGRLLAERMNAWRWGDGVVLPGPAAGVGWARRTGLDHALAAAAGRDRADLLIATTDADSCVPPHWLVALHALLDGGHEVIAGDVVLEGTADPSLTAARAARLAHRLESVRRHDAAAEHPHFAGANLAWTAEALRSLTPLPTPPALEDDALHRACVAKGLRITRDATFPVTTSARTDGRASLGLSAALRADAARLGLEPTAA